MKNNKDNQSEGSLNKFVSEKIDNFVELVSKSFEVKLENSFQAIIDQKTLDFAKLLERNINNFYEEVEKKLLLSPNVNDYFNGSDAEAYEQQSLEQLQERAKKLH